MTLPLMTLALLAAPAADVDLISVTKIWDQAPHNAFTDLARFNDRWFCTFREGAKHVSPDGSIHVIASKDGKDWQSAARLTMAHADLRDPKLTITPDSRLMLTAAAAWHDKSKRSHTTHVWFSKDGAVWTDPTAIGDDDYWLWRVTWIKETALGIGYSTGSAKDLRLYRSADGRDFPRIDANLPKGGYPNETAIIPAGNGSVMCLLRRDQTPNTGMLGTAKAPYDRWEWKELNVRIGGPNMIALPNRPIIAVVRLYDGKVRTAVCTLDPDKGFLKEQVALPSSGDSSYAGLVWHDRQLWVSYYSSHESKTSIYLAKLTVRETAK